MEKSTNKSISEICDTYVELIEQKAKINNDQKSNCFILPFIIGDKTDYFKEGLLSKIQSRYKATCYFFQEIKDSDSCDSFSKDLLDNIEKIKCGMSEGIYTFNKQIYTPIIIMLSSKLVSNIQNYLDKIISILKDDFTSIKMDIYFIVDEYNSEITKNKKAAIENTKAFASNRNIQFENFYFLGESSFIFSQKKLDIAVNTIENNIFYKMTNVNAFNDWKGSISELEARRKNYSGKALENLDCNWVSLGYVKFDLAKYTILYHLKKFLENQIGNTQLPEKEKATTLDEIKYVESEIDKYLDLKYQRENVLKHVNAIPIDKSKIDIIKLKKKKFFGFFSKNKDHSVFQIKDLESILFNDSNYFVKYIDKNIRKDVEEFNIQQRVSSLEILNNLDEILKTLYSDTLNNIDEMKINLGFEEKKIIDKTYSLSSYMGEFRKNYLELKFDLYITNKKLALIENAINSNKGKITDVGNFKDDKKTQLNIVDNLIEKNTFDNSNFKSTADKIIQSKIKQDIFDSIPWNYTFDDAVDYVGIDNFIDYILNILKEIYQSDSDKLSKDFKNILDNDPSNKYCIKYIDGIPLGEKLYKPSTSTNKNILYYEYFDSIMNNSTSSIKTEI